MKKNIYGYTGKILRVDLSTGDIAIEPTTRYAKKWLGMRGIGQSILYSELKPWVTSYEPANKITVEVGPLTGTLAPASTRYSMSSKNPFTGGVGTTNSCGTFGPELKYAGYDLIVIEGKASTPVYLQIMDDHVELKDASKLWGHTTWETEDLIREELSDEEVQVACIGPAGENLVRGACVIANKNRACGKCGLGGILGSKNLKAIAVRGSGSVAVAQPERFMEAVNDARERIANSPAMQDLGEFGTLSVLRGKNENSSIPYKNFQENSLPEQSLENLDPRLIMDRYRVRKKASMACPVNCSRITRVNHGPYAGLVTEAFQTVTLCDYGGKLAIDYAPALIKVHALCNQLGVDLDASSGAISYAFECYQRGLINENDTDGLKLEWGDYGVVCELIRKLAYREGFGNILAEGCKRASDIIGRDSSYYAMHMKGQDLYETIRTPIGWGFGACVSTRGGGHTTGAPACEPALAVNEKMAELAKKITGIKNVDPQSYEDKPELVIYFEREQELVHALGLCMFVGTYYDFNLIGIPNLAEFYSAATGWETTEDELINIADRIFNLEKAFNLLHTDLGRKDDFPPERLMKEPIKTGKLAGFALSEEKWNAMLSHYYKLRGWNPDTGFPTRKTLETLDLSDVADALERAGKLGNVRK